MKKFKITQKIVNDYHIPPDVCELAENMPQDYTISQAANFLQEKCHKASYDAGWWHDAECNPTKDNPLTFSNKLMLIVSEIAEAMEGDRKDCMDDKLPHRKMAEVELADAIIRIMDLAGAYGFDIGGAIAEKMEYNKSRKDHSKEARQNTGGKKY
jgi:NTP pyrophosphatase (non-canonical NTP hydrolase)